MQSALTVVDELSTNLPGIMSDQGLDSRSTAVPGCVPYLVLKTLDVLHDELGVLKRCWTLFRVVSHIVLTPPSHHAVHPVLATAAPAAVG